MQSESLFHSLVSGHANPCLLADELRAGAGGSGPRLTLPVPLTIASPSGCLAPVCRQLSLGLSGQVCVPPPCLSCRGGRGGVVSHTSTFENSCSPCSLRLCCPTPTLRSHCQQRLLGATLSPAVTLSPAAANFPADVTAGSQSPWGPGIA